MPIDFPAFTNEQKESLFQHYKKDYTGVTAGAFESQMFTSRLTDNRYSKSIFNEEYRATHGFLFDFITDHLPFDDIVNVKIHRQYRNAEKVHLDFANPQDNIELYNNNVYNEPCGFRMVVAGVRQGALHIENSKKEKIYPYLPETTDWYCLNSTNAKHAVETLDNGRMIIFTHGWINLDKHNLIINRSLEKYGEYAVWDS